MFNRFIVIAPLLILLSCTNSQVLSKKSFYEIDIQFDAIKEVLNGKTKVIWNNTSDSLVKELHFHFQSDSLKSNINSVFVNNNEVNIKYVSKISHGFDGFVLLLNTPIKSNEVTHIEIDFTTKRRLIGEHDKEIINDNTYFFLKDFPQLPFLKDGYFVHDYQVHSDYQVTIAYDSIFEMASTGIIEKESKENGRVISTTFAKDVPSYGILFFRNAIVKEKRTASNVLIRSIFFDDDQKWGNLLLDYAEDVLEFYTDSLEFYPQPVLNIIPGYSKPYGGWPVSPNIIGIHRGIDLKKKRAETHAKWITAHEIGHQYWGFNYVLEPLNYPQWFGIGMGIYTDHLYSMKNGIDIDYSDYFSSSYFEGVKRGYNTTIMQTVDTLNKQGFDWNNIIMHDKSYSVLRMLAYEIGEDTFFKIFKHCLNSYKGVNVTLEMFKKDCEQISQTNLDDFFNTWFYSSDYLEYQIENVLVTNKENQYTNKIIINKLGKAKISHVELAIVLNNGEIINQTFDGKQSNTTLEIDTNESIKKIILDPDLKLLMVNKKDWNKNN